MENKEQNKFSKIINNYDDIDIKNIKDINQQNVIKKDIIQPIPIKNFLNKNYINQNMPTIMDRTNKLFNPKIDLGRKVEESKNVETDDYANKENIFRYNNNSLMTNENEKNALNNNTFNYSKYKNNIKEMLSLNKNILNNINSLINNDNNEDKNKNKPDLNNATTELDDKKFDTNDKYRTSYTSINQTINSMKNEYSKVNEENKKQGKTFFNYNEQLEKQIEGKEEEKGGEDNLLLNNNNNNDKLNLLKNKENKTDNNSTNNFIQPETNLNKIGKLRVGTFNSLTENKFSAILKDFNKDKNKDNILKEEKKEEFKKPITNINNTFTNFNTFSNTNNGYYFDYKNDIPFEKFNEENEQKNKVTDKALFNNNEYNSYNKNDNYLKLNNDNNLKFNNYLSGEDLKLKLNNINNNNKYDSNDSKKYLEEKDRLEQKIKELEEAKNQLLKEKNERKQLFNSRISKTDTNYNPSENDDLILNKNKKNEHQLKKYNYFNNNNTQSYYKELLNETRKINQIINGNGTETLNNTINKLNDNYNFDKINLNQTTPKRRSLTIDYKQNEIKDYLPNYNKNIINNNNNNNDNNKNIYTNNNITLDRDYNINNNSYNTNSYLKMKDKENDMDNNNNYKNIYSNIMSSFNFDSNKDNDYMKGGDGNYNNRNNYHLSLTPKVLYRDNKYNNYIYNTNPRTYRNDNLDYNFNNNNNFNSLTQARSYRNNTTFFDQPVPTIENIRIKTINTLKGFSNRSLPLNYTFKKQNSTRNLPNFNFDLDKDYNNYNNYMINPQSNSLFNTKYNNTLNNTQPNFFSNNNPINKRSNSYRCKCGSLQKEYSYNNLNKLIEPNNQYYMNNNTVSPFNNNYNTYKTNNLEFGSYSNTIKRNNYNYLNMPIAGHNRNNNYWNLYNGNRNFCQKCGRNHSFNDKYYYGNTFSNFNTTRLWNNFKYRFGDNNFVKSNNYFSFI